MDNPQVKNTWRFYKNFYRLDSLDFFEKMIFLENASTN